MAELLDERPVEDADEITSLEAVEEQIEAEPQEEELPEKYQGKSMKDLVRMHQEAEKLSGRQSQEVGDLRKSVDQLIQTQLATAPTEPEEEVDFFLEPDKAVNKAIDSHPAIKEAQAAAVEHKKAAALASLQSQHPDMKEILTDKSFADWVGASKIRMQLFSQADTSYDYDSANELFSLWKERKELSGQTLKMEQASRKQQVQQANTGSVRGSGEPSSRKVYRRADIIKLMKDDPTRYEAMGDEIRKAYADGRVR